MSYMTRIKTQLRNMGLYEDDYRMFPVDVDHLGNPVFRCTPLALKNRMIFTENENPTLWVAVPLNHATDFRKALIGYCFKDGEIRWDAEFIIHNSLMGKQEIELPVHLVMYAPQYPMHLRTHLAFEKHKRSVDRKRIVVKKSSPLKP
jgi:hypothetical protein